VLTELARKLEAARQQRQARRLTARTAAAPVADKTDKTPLTGPSAKRTLASSG
jgi:hypothetical protein